MAPAPRILQAVAMSYHRPQARVVGRVDPGLSPGKPSGLDAERSSAALWRSESFYVSKYSGKQRKNSGRLAVISFVETDGAQDFRQEREVGRC